MGSYGNLVKTILDAPFWVQEALFIDFLESFETKLGVKTDIKKEDIYTHYVPELTFKGKKEFDLYWSRDEIVVTDIISEAPLRTDEPHRIMLEKMLVDMVADKLISTTYSKVELSDVIEQAQSRYYLDKVRLLRYARRRNREKEMKQYLEGSAIENAVT